MMMASLLVDGRPVWGDLTLQPDVPLKILERFEPEQSFILDPGDMLYLPPRYAHDGVAVGGDCMTISIGLRAPTGSELASDLLVRMAESMADADPTGRAARRYTDAAQTAVTAPAAMPAALQAFARGAVQAALSDPFAVDRALGESLTEPKAHVFFEPGEEPVSWRVLALDQRTRMLYDDQHVYINGESFRASGRDAMLMRLLADQRTLDSRALARASEGARSLLVEWCEAGWLHVD